MKTYSELIKLSTFEERLNYLSMRGNVGMSTFGHDRYINQLLYISKDWLEVRDRVMLRDNGHELGMIDERYKIHGTITVHHMNPITVEDILYRRDYVLNEEYLITCSDAVHKSIHYSNQDYENRYVVAERKPFDTCPWIKQ